MEASSSVYEFIKSTLNWLGFIVYTQFDVEKLIFMIVFH